MHVHLHLQSHVLIEERVERKVPEFIQSEKRHELYFLLLVQRVPFYQNFMSMKYLFRHLPFRRLEPQVAQHCLQIFRQ